MHQMLSVDNLSWNIAAI